MERIDYEFEHYGQTIRVMGWADNGGRWSVNGGPCWMRDYRTPEQAEAAAREEVMWQFVEGRFSKTSVGGRA